MLEKKSKGIKDMHNLESNYDTKRSERKSDANFKTCETHEESPGEFFVASYVSFAWDMPVPLWFLSFHSLWLPKCLATGKPSQKGNAFSNPFRCHTGLFTSQTLQEGLHVNTYTY